MEDYKSNSDKARQEQQSEKKVEAVITGAAKTRKKGEMQKFADVFIAEDANNVKSYILMEVIVPAVKKAISDIVTTGIDMILYGEAGRSKKNGTASKVSYRNYYDQGTDRVRAGSVGNRRNTPDYDDILFDTRGDIARYATVEKCCDLYGKKYIDSAKDICKENKKHPYAWTATGTQFQIPYVFKTLFSKENIEFEDMCETKSVTSSLYLDMNEALPNVSALEAERDKLWKQITDSKRMTEPMPTECERVEELTDEIAKGHDYHFIGKVGQFCPIKPGCGGGILLRETENKKTGEKGYAAATGSKGFRWLESEMVKQLDKQGDIDRGYYNNMVDEAIKSLSVYGDFERFAADEPYVSDNTPPWFGAGEPHEDDTTPFDVR